MEDFESIHRVKPNNKNHNYSVYDDEPISDGHINDLQSMQEGYRNNLFSNSNVSRNNEESG